jgi:hypothetical protein
VRVSSCKDDNKIQAPTHPRRMVGKIVDVELRGRETRIRNEDEDKL